MPLHDWLTLASLCIVGAMFPGASLAVVLRQTLNSRLHGIITGITHALGIGIYAVLSVSGLALLLQESPNVVQVISYAGAAYLLWLGYQGLTAKASPIATSNEAISAPHTSLSKAARDGFLIAMLNPKVGLYFLALFSQFIHADMGLAGKVIFVATITLIDGGWYVLVAAVLAHGTRLDWLRAHQVWVERVFGIILIALALRILFT